MSVDIKELKLMGTLAASTVLTKEYTPKEGKEYKIISFVGGIPADSDCCSNLTWDLGGNDERMLWVLQGESKMPFMERRRGHDGVKKLTLTLDNQSAKSVTMSVYVKILEEV